MRVGRGLSGAIATHAALTTGIHGVGSDDVASDAEITTHAAISATASVKGHATAAQITKLDAIEALAKADQTGVEIVALLEALAGDARLAHTSLSAVGAADHHAKYLDAAAVTAVGILVAYGTYSGNGADDRQIATGFLPKLVIVVMTHATNSARTWIAEWATYSVRLKDDVVEDSATDVLLHASDGFVVDSVNANGGATNYTYIAYG